MNATNNLAAELATAAGMAAGFRAALANLASLGLALRAIRAKPVKRHFVTLDKKSAGNDRAAGQVQRTHA